MKKQDPHLSSTPSSFHDDAYRRDAGHDAMQQSFLEFLRVRPIAGVPDGDLVRRTVEGEFALYRHGQIVAFADAAETLHVNLFTAISLFEIKPKIHTVYGVVRQVKPLLALAQQTIRADQHWCFAIVPRADPLLHALRTEWPQTWGCEPRTNRLETE